MVMLKMLTTQRMQKTAAKMVRMPFVQQTHAIVHFPLLHSKMTMMQNMTVT